MPKVVNTKSWDLTSAGGVKDSFQPPVYDQLTWLGNIPNVTFIQNGSQQEFDLAPYGTAPVGVTRYHYLDDTEMPAGVTLGDTTGILTYNGTSPIGSTAATLTLTDTEVQPPVEPPIDPPVDPPDPPELPPPGQTAFGEIQEVFFVNGFPETEHLGIWFLDVNNRWTPGDLNNDSGWLPAQLTSMIDADTGVAVDDPYISYDPATAIVSYTGMDINQKSRTLNCYLTDGTNNSRNFRVRVIHPTLVFGEVDYGTALNEQGLLNVTMTGARAASIPHHRAGDYNNMGQALWPYDNPASDDNMIFMTEYDRENTPTNLVGAYFEVENYAGLYVTGKPNLRTEIGRDFDITQWNWRWCSNVRISNLICHGGKSWLRDIDNMIINKFYNCNTGGQDSIMWDSFTEDYMDAGGEGFGEGWIINSEFTKCGASGTKHPFYLQARDEQYGRLNGARVYLYVNNLSTYGNCDTRTQWDVTSGEYPESAYTAGQKAQGSINIKAVNYYSAIRNTYSGAVDDWDDPWNAANSSQLVSFHTQQNLVLYNNHFKGFASSIGGFGQSDFLMLQNRNVIGLGGTDPGNWKKDATTFYTGNKGDSALYIYFPLIPAYDPSPAWLRASQTPLPAGPFNVSPAFHGINDYVTVIPPVDAPYWDDVVAGGLNDPENTLLFRHFISYNTFEYVDIRDKLTNPIIIASIKDASSMFRDHGSHPQCPWKQYATSYIYYNVPPNWVERSTHWSANNTFINQGTAIRYDQFYNTRDHYGGFEDYPYAPTPENVAANPSYFKNYSEMNPVNELGGDTTPESPVPPVPLPDWFLR